LDVVAIVPAAGRSRKFCVRNMRINKSTCSHMCVVVTWEVVHLPQQLPSHHGFTVDEAAPL
jgi:hypothetical protein